MQPSIGDKFTAINKDDKDDYIAGIVTSIKYRNDGKFITGGSNSGGPVWEYDIIISVDSNMRFYYPDSDYDITIVPKYILDWKKKLSVI
jgi:hypothetical protein